MTRRKTEFLAIVRADRTSVAVALKFAMVARQDKEQSHDEEERSKIPIYRH